MKVLVQWSLLNPTDWVEYDLKNINEVRRLPRKNVPSASSQVDNQFGWPAAINIQGVIFSGNDHIGFELVGQTLVVTSWNDDPDDFPVGERYGSKWTFGVPTDNTVQTVTRYGEPNSIPAQQGISLLPYSELTFPPANQTLHGIWLTDPLWDTHVNRRSMHGWREWVL